MRTGPPALALWVALAGPALGADSGTGLEVRVYTEQAEATLHAQVLLRVEVTHRLGARPRWEPPVFEGFWAERLSSLGGALEGRSAGEVVRTTTFRRALFPTRSGKLVIERSLLHYRDEDDLEQTLEVPGAELRVRPLPEQGRPEGFQNIVGQLRIETELSATEIELGESLEVGVDIYGTANSWDVATLDLEALLGEAFEVFPDPPLLVLGEQGDRLTARRTFRFQLVPQETGFHRFPVITMAHFDPDARGYRVARSEAISFRVLAAGARVPRGARASSPHTPAPTQLPWLLIGGIVALVGTLSGWSLARWWRHGPRVWQGPTPPPPRTLFETARAALGTERFPALLAQAVKARIHVCHRLDAQALCSEEIAARIDDRQAVDLLRALDRARFGRCESHPEELLASAQRYLEL